MKKAQKHSDKNPALKRARSVPFPSEGGEHHWDGETLTKVADASDAAAPADAVSDDSQAGNTEPASGRNGRRKHHEE